MIVKNSHLKASWSDFFEESVDETFENYPYRETTLSTSENNVWIFGCTFTECSNSLNNGGAILCTSSSGNFLTEFSTFNQCSVTGQDLNGGAIHVNSTTMNCVINCVCGFKCHTTETGYGQFINSDVGEDEKKNYIIQSSICSTYDIQGNRTPIRNYYGKQICSFVNVSNYKVRYFSAIFYFIGSNRTEISFSSFNSNEATEYVCIDLSKVTSRISKCNIINNIQGSSEYGTLSCSGMTTIEDCCILDDRETANWYLFEAEEMIIVSNCTLPRSGNKLIKGSVNITYNNGPSFIHGFILTQNESYCRAGPDSVGDLTPVLPVRSPLVTQKLNQNSHSRILDSISNIRIKSCTHKLSTRMQQFYIKLGISTSDPTKEDKNNCVNQMNNSRSSFHLYNLIDDITTNYNQLSFFILFKHATIILSI